MKSRQYYYRVIGENRYIPLTITIKAESVKDAKIVFYLLHGDNITILYRTRKPLNQ